MSPEEKRAYGRGYNAKSRHWPEHVPPLPPDPIITEVMESLRALRDGVDGELATFAEDDEITARLRPLIERADDSLAAVSAWIKEQR